jgi:hypothetical protein
MSVTSAVGGAPKNSIDGDTTLLSGYSRTNAEVNLTMRAVIREILMVPLLFVAALVGISLTVSGHWATWQSLKPSSDGMMPLALATITERRPLAEFILVDDAKGVFDLKSLESHWSFIFFGFSAAQECWVIQGED